MFLMILMSVLGYYSWLRFTTAVFTVLKLRVTLCSILLRKLSSSSPSTEESNSLESTFTLPAFVFGEIAAAATRL
ncbi:hypothetical protein VF12_38625 [Nostoc linckia z15]|nr:hypothetical protein VF12_38625 [Nostoc linckia z15]